jgi:hypothetical protein
MKMRVICALSLIASLALLSGCSGGGSASVPTGTVSMDVADAKPFVTGTQPDEVWIVIEEVQVHTSSGGWASLDLPQKPLEINLLAFCDGLKTELATPTEIPAGHITQMRLEISRAYMVFKGVPPDPDTVEEIDLDVPSGTLRTDKQIDWTLGAGGAISLTVHFDLSQSIVQVGEEYKLKPVLHLFDNNTQDAAAISGSIADSTFGEQPEEIIISVTRNWTDENQQPRNETYTVVTVARDPDTDPTEFGIYWLVPLEEGESYTIQAYKGDVLVYGDTVSYPELGPGGSFELNGGAAI